MRAFSYFLASLFMRGGGERLSSYQRMSARLWGFSDSEYLRLFVQGRKKSRFSLRFK